LHAFLVITFVVIGAALVPNNSLAQDCDRFAWACEGWSGPTSRPGGAAPFRVEPDSRRGTEGPLSAPNNAPPPIDARLGSQYARLYAQVTGEPFPVSAVRLSEIDPRYLRQSVYYPTREPPGTIIIDPNRRFLYFVEGGGRAIRYGVGVGREGFAWSGVATVNDKQKWPDWYPPKEMLQRQPELRRQVTPLRGGLGVPGGPGNPLGARALYLWQGNKDTLYRIHGTFEPWTIGQNVSSGCIRMINQDIMDLYERTQPGSRVVVLSGD
jgi:lipoprotein-anchoring transpeptidase ErfK/SrfK